jgi:hypothetical protein
LWQSVRNPSVNRSQETDLQRKAAENAHRQAQADVATFLFILGEGAWSVM